MCEDELDQQEKEALKKEILEEVKKRESIREILSELEPPNKTQFSNFLKHPVVLLVLGFLFTGVIGAWLTSYWKTKEWDYQQKRLRQVSQAEQLVKHKTEIRDEVRKDTENALGADSEIVALILAEANTNTRSKDIEERKTRWRESVRQWNTDLGKMRQAISSEFTTGTGLATLEQLGKQMAILTTDIESVLDELERANWKMTTTDVEDFTTIRSLLAETRDAVKKLLEIMAKEIQGDEAIATQPV